MVASTKFNVLSPEFRRRSAEFGAAQAANDVFRRTSEVGLIGLPRDPEIQDVIPEKFKTLGVIFGGEMHVADGHVNWEKSEWRYTQIVNPGGDYTAPDPSVLGATTKYAYKYA